jgi:hypothetical protein
MQVEVWQFLRAFLFLTRATPTTFSDMSECSRYFGARRATRGNTSSSPLFSVLFCGRQVSGPFKISQNDPVHSRIESISDILMITLRRDTCATVNYEPDSFESRSWRMDQVVEVSGSDAYFELSTVASNRRCRKIPKATSTSTSNNKLYG